MSRACEIAPARPSTVPPCRRRRAADARPDRRPCSLASRCRGSRSSPMAARSRSSTRERQLATWGINILHFRHGAGGPQPAARDLPAGGVLDVVSRHLWKCPPVDVQIGPRTAIPAVFILVSPLDRLAKGHARTVRSVRHPSPPLWTATMATPLAAGGRGRRAFVRRCRTAHVPSETLGRRDEHAWLESVR